LVRSTHQKMEKAFPKRVVHSTLDKYATSHWEEVIVEQRQKMNIEYLERMDKEIDAQIEAGKTRF
jgi:hypothetical protein